MTPWSQAELTCLSEEPSKLYRTGLYHQHDWMTILEVSSIVPVFIVMYDWVHYLSMFFKQCCCRWQSSEKVNTILFSANSWHLTQILSSMSFRNRLKRNVLYVRLVDCGTPEEAKKGHETLPMNLTLKHEVINVGREPVKKISLESMFGIKILHSEF